jgi:glycerol-3-phosphate dehydrogenase
LYNKKDNGMIGSEAFMRESYDIAIIGAGVCGCAVAFELSKYVVSCVLVEKEPDVSMGTTKANVDYSCRI